MNTSTCLLNRTGIDVFIWQIGAFIFPILGIPGHLIMIIVMLNSNKKRSQPTSLYFISISITELIYLIFIFWDWLDIINLVPDPLLLVQLNLDRILIIKKPQQIHLYITYKRILIKIFLTFNILILFIVHYYFSLYYNEKSFIIFGQSCYVYKNAHTWFYLIWPYIHLLSRLILCLIIIYCTIFIFYNRFYKKNCLYRQQERTFSLGLIILSIYTFLGIIPITIIQIFNQYTLKYQIKYSCIKINDYAQQWKLLNVICIMWETSIYIIKFYIKLLFSSKFRHDIKQLIICRSITQINMKN